MLESLHFHIAITLLARLCNTHEIPFISPQWEENGSTTDHRSLTTESSCKSLCWQVNSLNSFLYASSLASGQHKYLRAEHSCEQSKPVLVKGHKFFPLTRCVSHMPQQTTWTLGQLSLYPLTWYPPDGGSSPQVSWQPVCFICWQFWMLPKFLYKADSTPPHFS